MNKDRKQIVQTINVMSNILSFLDHEKMNLMKLTRIIIDFGWYPHAKLLLEKYYSEIPYHRKVFDNDNGNVVTGPYLLQMMGYFHKNIMGYDHNYESFVYFRNNDDKYVEQSYGIDRYDDTDTIIRYDEKGDDNSYEFTYINLFDTDLDKAIKLNNIFDICNNTLHISDSKCKFTFAKSLPAMLSKKISIDIDMKLVNSTYNNITRKYAGNRYLYVSKICAYITYGFSFDFKQLLPIDRLCYRVVEIKENIITDMKICNQIIDKFNLLKNEIKPSIIRQMRHPDDDNIKICDNGVYNLVICEKNVIKLISIHGWSKLIYDASKLITAAEEYSVLHKSGNAIKMNVLGEDILFVKEKL